MPEEHEVVKDENGMAAKICKELEWLASEYRQEANSEFRMEIIRTRMDLLSLLNTIPGQQ